jgi:Leucine-rich repeat (LRR) protein
MLFYDLAMTKRKVEDISETSGNNGVLNEHESNKRFHQESIGESDRFKIRVELQNKNSTLDHNKITNGVVNKVINFKKMATIKFRYESIFMLNLNIKDQKNSKYMLESTDDKRKRMIQEALFESECAKSMVKILPKYVSSHVQKLKITDQDNRIMKIIISLLNKKVENSNDSLNTETKFVAKLCRTFTDLTKFVNNKYNQNEESISISYQYIPLFSLAPFEIFIKLKALYIMDTNTKTFMNPINLPNLEMLKFASNQIETLNVNTFSNLTNLQTINFSKNKITQLNSNIFKVCKS